MRFCAYRAPMAVFLFLDIDGYCHGGVKQDQIITALADGYRARELGWAVFAKTTFEAGSVYFYDSPTISKIDRRSPSIKHISSSVHGLPVAPGRSDYKGELAAPSDRLLDIIRVLCQFAASLCAKDEPVVVVHKGGNEGTWVRHAYPGGVTLDLSEVGCPKVDKIGKEHPEWLEMAGGPCAHHEFLSSSAMSGKHRKKKGIVHCPSLEVKLLAIWVAFGDQLLLSE